MRFLIRHLWQNPLAAVVLGLLLGGLGTRAIIVWAMGDVVPLPIFLAIVGLLLLQLLVNAPESAVSWYIARQVRRERSSEVAEHA